jgi:regulatory protein
VPIKSQLTKEQALQKLKHYCAYQERCHSEVTDKLYQLGVPKRFHDEITANLIVENYLDEERFAIAYAGGKFRVKHWGRVKIKYALQQKKVSTYSTKVALKQLDEDEYKQKLKRLLDDKYAELKNEQYLVRKKKTMDYLMHKGFEPELIRQAFEK